MNFSCGLQRFSISSLNSTARRLTRPSVITRRLNSTTASIPKSAPENLSWPQYLAIRRSKTKWQAALTIPSAILGFVGGVTYFGTRETDPTKPILGIDPFFFYGFCTLGCAGAGWLVGPSLGTAIWRTTHRQFATLIDAKDKEFYTRIAKNRVPAELQSPTNPVPDYYGERIGSLHQYRQWLRDQAKYKKKAVLPEE